MPATNKNPPSSPSHTKTQENDQLETINKLIESKFSLIEESISSVEQQVESQNVEFVSLISKIKESTKTALELGNANPAKLKYNLDHIDSNSYEVNQLNDQVSHLGEQMKKLRSKLEDTRNGGLRKTLLRTFHFNNNVTKNRGMKVKKVLPKN